MNKIITKFGSLILIFFFFGASTNTQWVQVPNGMGTGMDVRSLGMLGNNVFAGTNGSSVYVSTNSGTNWTPTALSGQTFCFAVKGGNILAGTGVGVYITTNNGANWTLTSLTEYTLSLTLSGDNIFAGTYQHGTYISTNNGINWTQTALTDRTVWSMAAIGNNIFAGTAYFYGVYLSTNNGASWVQTSLSNQVILSLATLGNSIFAGTTNGVYRSTNSGSTWTTVNNGLTDFYINSLGFSGTNIFAGTEGGIFLSTNNGATWYEKNHGFGYIWNVFSVMAVNDYLFAGTLQSVWRLGLTIPPLPPVLISPANNTTENLLNLNLAWNKSEFAIAYNVVLATDPAFSNIVLDTVLNDTIKAVQNLSPVTDYFWKVRSKIISEWGVFSTYYKFGTCSPWYPMYSGINNTDVNSFLVTGTNVYTGTMGGVFLSTNNGLNWTAINSGLTNLYVTALISNGANLFAGTEGGGIFLSTNNGGFWIAVNSGLYSQSIRSFVMSGNNIFAATSGGVYRSSNNGANWTDAGLMYQNVKTLYVNGSIIYAGTSSGLYFTANNGINWNAAFGTMNINSILISGVNLFVGTTAGVFLSTNNGNNWIASSLTNQSVYALVINGNKMFAGTESGGVFLSTNNSNDWLEKNQGFNTVPSVRSFLVLNNNILAGTFGQTVWSRDLSLIIGIDPVSEIVPVSYFLKQNYPNPFNPSTKIRFDLPKSHFVTLKVYDMLGRVIVTLVNDQLKPGTYEVDWNAGDFSSGIYFYRIVADVFIDVKKMVLIK